VAYLRQKFPDADLAVVIAYDVRVYRDRSNHSDRARPNPLLGLSSRDLAELAARVYVANGVRVHLQRRGDPRFLSTPELSFAIRALRAHGGLNVSASHNPPDDNGGKFYDHRGGQAIPPDDERMLALVEAVTEVHTLSWQKAKDSGLLLTLGEDVHEAYVAHVAGRSLVPARSARIAFTPLHGTGIGTVAEVLRRVGFEVVPVEAQCAPDGDFPTVPFRAPNPEVPRAFDVGIEVAEANGCDLVLATDPDADRIGAMVRHGGGWRFLTGNELGLLVIHHALSHGRFPGRPIVMTTEVTSGALPRVASAMGAQTIGYLLVGFKYVAECLREIEETGRSGSVAGALGDFAAGIEESHGVLVTPDIRDKDAAGGGLYLAEAASLAKDAGRTLVDVLDRIWNEHGYVRNELISTVMRGAIGRARIDAIQTSFRSNPPSAIGGRAVTAFHDRRDASGPFGPIRSGTDAASRDVLVFELGDEARVILRPSGTEPKNKAYVEVRGRRGVDDPAAERARVDREARALAEAFVDDMLGRVGLGFPAWAHGVSDLVSVEGRIAFANEILPELVRRLAAEEPVDGWIDTALAPLGKDPRRLVEGAVARYCASERPGVEPALRRLFGL
jgi:phosphoglucomutase/phosphomannomutase